MPAARAAIWGQPVQKAGKPGQCAGVHARGRVDWYNFWGGLFRLSMTGFYAAALTFLLLPVAGFSQDSQDALASLTGKSVVFPAPDASSNRTFRFEATASSEPFVLLLPDFSCQANETASNCVPEQSSPGKAPQGKHEKPHLIELSSANWRPLTRREKFDLFGRDLLHWSTHASLAFDAGISAAIGDRPYLGTGAAGYFRKYGLNVADEADFTFFNAFFFPTIFHEDPRYIPFDHGTVRQRIGYALSRVALTRNDSGKTEFNKSKVFGTIIATSISTAYYSAFGADVGIAGNFENVAINLASDAAFDLFKEFWPDVARKLKLNVWIRNLVRAAIRDEVRIS